MLLGENIKQLRLKKNITQETLAEQLNISSTAVSKWERNETLPDISMIIPLANYFGVSTDDILGYDTKKNETKIQWYIDEHKRLLDSFKIEEAEHVIKEAHREYPNDFRITHLYIWKLAGNDQTNFIKHEKELHSLCQRILNECTIDYIRNSAISLLAKIYHAKGETHEAIKILERFPHWYGCVYESECERLYETGTEEWWYWVHRNFFDLTYFAESKLMKLIWNSNRTLDSKILVSLHGIEFIKQFCEETDYPYGYFHIMSIYSTIANQCIHNKRLEDAVNYYDWYLKYAKQLDDFIKSSKQLPNTSQSLKKDIIKNWGSSDCYNQVKRMIVYLENGNLFKELHPLNSFKELIKKYNYFAHELE